MVLTVAVMAATFAPISAQTKVNADSIRDKMQWFADARLGVFIHWGIYAAAGVDEGWSFFDKKISHPDYIEQFKGFSASNYSPDEWGD